LERLNWITRSICALGFATKQQFNIYCMDSKK
jgi:hypothetical protein